MYLHVVKHHPVAQKKLSMPGVKEAVGVMCMSTHLCTKSNVFTLNPGFVQMLVSDPTWCCAT